MNPKIVIVALALAVALPSAWAETRQNVPPASATNHMHKAKTPRLRGCFRDADKDGKCDRSVNDGGKCKANCVDPNVKPEAAKPSLRPPSRKTGEEKNLGKLTLPDCCHGLRFGCSGCGACLKGYARVPATPRIQKQTGCSKKRSDGKRGLARYTAC